MTAACTNCGAKSPAQLDHQTSADTTLVTSDAQQLMNTTVERRICGHCGCIDIVYTPADALGRHFSQDYDTSDPVQDNLVTTQGKTVHKRSLVETRMHACFDQDLPPSGAFLEIACGRGHLTRDFAQRHTDWTCVGIDPSPDLPAGPQETERLTFRREFFNAERLAPRQFDAIVAHGLLNRCPTLPTLREISTLCRPNARLSFELLTLEQSIFMPRVWDHPFMYTEPVLRIWLDWAGLELLDIADCGSATHVLCRKAGPASGMEALQLPDTIITESKACYTAHQAWWQGVFEAYDSFLTARAGQAHLLFGAGMFNRVLASGGGLRHVSAVIDETKAGAFFMGRPVISLSEAAETGLPVAVCTRPGYLPVILEKISAAGLEAIPLAGPPHRAHGATA